MARLHRHGRQDDESRHHVGGRLHRGSKSDDEAPAPESGATLRRLQQAPSDLHRHRVYEARLAVELLAAPRTVAHRQHGLAVGHVHTGESSLAPGGPS